MSAPALLGPEYGQVHLPAPCGPWTRSLRTLLTPGGACAELDGEPMLVPHCARPEQVLADDDLQLALYLCYELHYSGLCGVDDRLEWSPLVLMLRATLEERFEQALRAVLVGEPHRPGSGFGSETMSVGAEIQRLVREDDGPSLSSHLERHATLEQALEFVVHRSAYQLKEADPHSWAVPRLRGGPKAALVEIQTEEYGDGRSERIHAELFADSMRALGLDATPGAYIPRLPGITLATVNLMSMFGLHRRLRGALVGHLATFELTSSVPNRRYANGWRRLGFGPEVTCFFDTHVEADAVHESIATWDLADALARQQPELADSILFGARALLALDTLWAEHLLGHWEQGQSSLREPLLLGTALA